MKSGIGSEGAQCIVVLGAAGKMGSGIALLILQQFALKLASLETKEGKQPLRLILIDTNGSGFPLLKKYLRDQLKKYAERNINELRDAFKSRLDLIDNGDMISSFIEEAIDCVFFGTLLEECRGAELVFEAIVEDVNVKADIFSKLNQLLGLNSYFFSNTSSIPIQILQEKSQLQGRLIGYHFYNPPVIQRLLELIIPENTCKSLVNLAEEIAKQLKKKVVYSKDVAGFIGNGHFIREVQYACEQVRILSQNMTLNEAIILVNRVTQEFLLRPMGIFQLIDYVGIDVVQRIANIMSTYLHNSFKNDLIDTMVKEKVLGGQFGDGSQKDGFFHYEKGLPVAIYDLKSKKYVLFTEIVSNFSEKPPLDYSWVKLSKDPNRADKIANYLKCLTLKDTLAAQLAQKFLDHSKKITSELVKDGIAVSEKDVETVLTNGFFHLY